MKFAQGCLYVLPRYVIPFWVIVAILVWLVIR
jgi:hypothetical protein